LHVYIVLAEPGSLRGLGQNRTRNASEANASFAGSLAEAASGAENASPAVVPSNLTEAALGADNASPAVVASNLTQATPGAWNASGALTTLAGAAEETPLLGSSSAAAGGTMYWDGHCTPCPVFFYGGHCARGGSLVWQRTCATTWYMCEGLCSTSGPAPGEVEKVSSPGTMTLYHTTSPEIAGKILASNTFKPGKMGWCGGAIYFYWSPNIPKTKLGPDSSDGAVIEVKVNMGRMATLDSHCDGHDEASGKYDSVTFNPGDGDEYIIFNTNRVLSMKRYS